MEGFGAMVEILKGSGKEALDLVKEMLDEVHKDMAEAMAEAHKVPSDWTYVDVPWGRREDLNGFLSVVGGANFVCVSLVGKSKGSVEQVRGQFFFSPEGIQRLRRWYLQNR